MTEDDVATGMRQPVWRRAAIAVVSLVVAAGIWLTVLHWFYRPGVEEFRVKGAVSPRARELAARHLALWQDPVRRAAELERMRVTNAEWDFMGRTYLVLALANMAIAEPQHEQEYLAVIDAIVDETQRLEAERGQFFFMMRYARAKSFIAPGGRSTFVDGEIALMLAARQTVRVEPRFAGPLKDRVSAVVEELGCGPVMCGESYPDECWMFCNSVAAAAVMMSDRLDGRDHSAFLAKWLETIKAKLVDEKTGILVSSFSYSGKFGDGPEGSSIWMIAHCLQVVDPAFAADQYRRAKEQIGAGVMGFGYAKEWPASWRGTVDVDSGPVVPVLDMSAGSTGLAILAAASFGDDEYLQGLLTSLQFAAFPVRGNGELKYAASNQVGDAVLLYALVQGPLWNRVKGGKP